MTKHSNIVRNSRIVRHSRAVKRSRVLTPSAVRAATRTVRQSDHEGPTIGDAR